ncbi:MULTISPECIES: hypothetical protein [Photobacterium]|uniref:Uncharacterized protein n=1 Tax=Photobacterium ganghwense TaxID=320778 RepID=A0A0J1H2R5_9GAMM|nr:MULTISPECIES: hypothetical protein [Photobacterium]KLV06070.1 hypothetical protein ABT57_20135 [Photobacterium ganghwense]MBV1839926.1 hypothetical protein [Photobacterium ganghwense]PSU04998.1 hypothetical protein C9I92_22900 [Photobacterium ganghwense]QSV14035.1 hypothetical protein FH974_15515 [Photobacterium ganghwense]
MARTLCKYRRAEIADKFTTISQIVSLPKYVCRSCARSASEKSYLCKPSTLQLPGGKRAAVITSALPAVAQPAVVAAEPVMAPAPSLPVAYTELPELGSMTAETVLPMGKSGKKQSKQLKKLRKLAKKKHKRLKKAAKAVKRYEKALKKARGLLIA